MLVSLRNVPQFLPVVTVGGAMEAESGMSLRSRAELYPSPFFYLSEASLGSVSPNLGTGPPDIMYH